MVVLGCSDLFWVSIGLAFGPFGLVWVVLACFDSFWVVFPRLALFRITFSQFSSSFWVVSGRFGIFCIVLGQFRLCFGSSYLVLAGFR